MKIQFNYLTSIIEKSQWLPNDNTIKLHFHNLVKHAYQTVPFYKKHYLKQHESILNSSIKIQDLPIYTRERLQLLSEEEAISNNIPLSHGSLYKDTTSGSTGVPVEVIGTDFMRLFYDALMFREHTWHKRDFSKKLMGIKWARRGFGEAPHGHIQENWGPPINQYSYPSQFAALAGYCVTHGLSFPFVEELRTTGEILSKSYVNLILKAWPHVRICDVYSCAEMGILAQQCPEMRRYHVNTEHVLLEIVDDNNEVCPVGQPGRVLLTSLLNYAKPLIRYDIGDYAEWGEACECGRKLPVIKHILGRRRNRLRLPNGNSIFPYLGEKEDFYNITHAVRKFQLIQRTIYHIEIKLVVIYLLSFDQELDLIQLIKKNLNFPYTITITYHDDIAAGAMGKYEEFIGIE